MTLRQDLEGVPVGPRHHLEDLSHVAHRNALMEYIAHRVDEDHPRPLPFERLAESRWPQAQIKALLIRTAGDPTPTVGEGFGVAVSASRRHLLAARHLIPRRFSPLDRTVVCHARRPSDAAISNTCSHAV